jgi:hypothetical protein
MGCIRILFSPVAALLGAVAMTVVALAGFAIALAALGAPASYRGDSWMASDTLLAILLGITFVATITGGAVARRMGGGLAVALLTLFAACTSLVPHLDSPLDAAQSQRFAGRPEARPSDATFADLATWTEHPDWMRYAGALMGVTGVLFGSSLAKGRRGSSRPKRGDD